MLLIGIAGFLAVDALFVAAIWTMFFDDTDKQIEKVAISFQLPDLEIATSNTENPTKTESAALSRPVFSATRRPFEAPPPPPPPPAAPPTQPAAPLLPDLIVDGIWLDGSVQKAHLRKRGETGGEWHKVGDVLNGWTIVAITASRVTLALDTQRYDVDLYPLIGQP